MKSIFNILVFATVFIAGCTKNSSNPSANGNSSNSTSITGNFVITKFTDSNPNEDKTTQFTGYVFTFTADGKIVAEKNGVTTTGSYVEKPSHEGEGAKLNIIFSDAPLNALSKNWQVNLISNSAIHLADDDNSSEVLEFTAQ